MIWFNCQQCGRKHSRPEASIGSMVFCECGHGNTVPWDSTTEPQPTVIAELLPPAPELAPVKFASEPSAPSRQIKPPERDDYPDRTRRPPPPPRSRPRPRDPSICMHHTARASHAVCTDCKNGFCEDCLIQMQGQPVCAACKIQRVKALQKASPTSQLALVSLLLALFTSPLAFCLYPLGSRFSLQRLSVWALLPQLAALGIGIWALTVTERNHRLGGRSLAISAIATASFAIFWTVFLTLYAVRLMGS
jgi:hypothetical protein